MQIDKVSKTNIYDIFMKEIECKANTVERWKNKAKIVSSIIQVKKQSSDKIEGGDCPLTTTLQQPRTTRS